MIIKTRGIIFRTVKYSETSVIADIYTEEKGLRSYIISGVRSKNARVKASVLQVMTLVDLVVYHRNDRELTRIKEIKAAYVYRSIPFDVVKGAVGLFMLELARKSIQESEENKPLFNYLFGTFQSLDSTTESVANFHITFMVGLTGFLGFMPGGTFSEQTPGFDLTEGVFTSMAVGGHRFLDQGQSQLLYTFLHLSVEQSHTIPLNKQERKAFLDQLILFYRLHVENFEGLNAYKVLETVLG